MARNTSPATAARASTRILTSSPARSFPGRRVTAARRAAPGFRRVSPTGAPGRSPPRSAARMSSPPWPRSAPGSSRARSPAAPARPASATISPPGRSRPGSGRRPGNGRSACGAPGSPAATRSGSAAMTASGGTSSCPPPWPGCWHRPERRDRHRAAPGASRVLRWPEGAGRACPEVPPIGAPSVTQQPRPVHSVHRRAGRKGAARRQTPRR